MSIPKTIYQTYKNKNLPLITKWHIYSLKKRNPNYDYQFYDDSMVDDFIKQEFNSEIVELFKRIQIGAAKADFFRYAILYKKGGIYLDIDNLKENKYPYNVHQMTGPTVYTESILSCLEELPNVKYRQLEVDYENKLKFSYSMSKFFLYGIRRKNHWKTIANEKTVLK